MPGDKGQEAEGRRDVDKFLDVVAALAEGNLAHPPPFDIVTSAALADNMDIGDIAQQLFDVTAQRQCGYRVSITALAPGHPELPEREVLNTQVTSLQLLTVLLDDLLDELHNRLTQD